MDVKEWAKLQESLLTSQLKIIREFLRRGEEYSSKPRNEHLNSAALKERGYGHNGWIFAPCEILTKPIFFEFSCQRESCSCRWQCVSAKDPTIVAYAKHCPYWMNYHGFIKHMSIRQFPRLILEVIRGYLPVSKAQGASPRL